MPYTTYYNVEIYETDDNTYEFSLHGWIYEVETVEEAKKKIKEWR